MKELIIEHSYVLLLELDMDVVRDASLSGGLADTELLELWLRMEMNLLAL